MHYTNLPAAIIRGSLDDILDPLYEAIVARRRALVEAEAIENLSLARGTRVELKAIRPKYMAGLTGEVVDAAVAREHDAVVRAGCINVMLDDSSFQYMLMKDRSGRRSRGQVVCVPASCLTARVSPATKTVAS